jgi:hypothetical protein
VNTPPPGTGVNAPAGYTASTDAMSSNARVIRDAAEDSQDAVRELKPTRMTDREFGNKHTAAFADFSASIDRLGTGADAMCANLTQFATQIGGASQAYAANDAQSAQNVSQVRR